MAASVGKSILAGKLPAGSLVKAHENVKNDLPPLRSLGLPPGIKNGVAKLVLCGFGEFAAGTRYAGKPYWQAQGIVLSPEYHGGIKVVGERTGIMPIPICDTPTAAGKRKTLQDNLAYMEAHLAALGLDVSKIKAKSDDEYERMLVAGMDELIRKPTFFIFETWSGSKSVTVQHQGKWYVTNLGRDGKPDLGANKKGPYPSKEAALKVNPYADTDPLTNESWIKACEWSGPAANSKIVDQTGSDLRAVPSEVQASSNGAAEEPPFTEDIDEQSTEDENSIEYLSALAAQATDQDDGDAQQYLTDRAIAAGMDKEDVESDSMDWHQIAEYIVASLDTGDAEPSAEAESAEFVPEVNTVYRYQQVDANGAPVKDPKSKKVNAPIEVVCTGLIAATKTAQCVDNASKKIKYSIAYDKLIVIE